MALVCCLPSLHSQPGHVHYLAVTGLRAPTLLEGKSLLAAGWPGHHWAGWLAGWLLAGLHLLYKLVLTSRPAVREREPE